MNQLDFCKPYDIVELNKNYGTYEKGDQFVIMSDWIPSTDCYWAKSLKYQFETTLKHDDIDLVKPAFCSQQVMAPGTDYLANYTREAFDE